MQEELSSLVKTSSSLKLKQDDLGNLLILSTTSGGNKILINDNI